MTEPYHKYRDRLRELNISHTKPRLAVFNTLLTRNHTPLSVSELIEACKLTADRASIYRSVIKLEDAGIIKKVNLGWKYKYELSDEFHGHHHHIGCTKCGKLIATPESKLLEEAILNMAIQYGFKRLSHHLEINGVCVSCQQKNGTPSTLEVLGKPHTSN